MSYTNEKTEYNLKDKKYSFSSGPKDYSDLKVKDNYGEEDYVSIVVYVRDKNYPLGPNDY